MRDCESCISSIGAGLAFGKFGWEHAMKLMKFFERYHCKNCIGIYNDSMTYAESLNDTTKMSTISISQKPHLAFA